jgi:hypothetical protein
MGTRTVEQQLVASLRDAHALEQMALAQLGRAPAIAGEDALKLALRDHWVETRVHERLMRERLEAHGAKPSALRDLAAEAGGAGFVLGEECAAAETIFALFDVAVHASLESVGAGTSS